MRPLDDLLPDPLLFPSRVSRRTSVPARRPFAGPSRAHHTPEAAARARLAPLLRAAADLDLDDVASVSMLHAAGREVTATLADEGRIPAGLVVGEHDPAVAVVRAIAAAWRALTPVGQATTCVRDGASASRCARKPARASR